MAEDDPTRNLTPDADPTAGLTTQELLRQILARLSALETKTPDTRPVWELALAEIMEVKGTVERIEKEVRQFDRKLDILNRGLLDLRAEHEDLAERVPPPQ